MVNQGVNQSDRKKLLGIVVGNYYLFIFSVHHFLLGEMLFPIPRDPCPHPRWEHMTVITPDRLSPGSWDLVQTPGY